MARRLYDNISALTYWKYARDKRRAGEFIAQTHRNLYWLRDFLKSRYGIEAWVNAAIVFPNAHVSVRRPLRGVEVINAKYLERWLAKQRGNPAAQKLWPQITQVRAELFYSGGL
jgi:hypothetical protein